MNFCGSLCGLLEYFLEKNFLPDYPCKSKATFSVREIKQNCLCTVIPYLSSKSVTSDNIVLIENGLIIN